MELRILSGLHRGAVMELDPDAGEITLGASPGGDFDVLLADAGIADRHCTISVAGGKLQLAPLDGPVHDEQGRPVTGPVVVERGRTLRIGNVWIGFFLEGDPAHESPDSPAPSKNGSRAGHYPRRKAHVITGTIAILMVPAAWFASMAWGNVSRLTQPPQAKVVVEDVSQAALTPVRAAPSEAPASPALLAEEFTRALVERDLRDRLDLQLQPTYWQIRGSLDGEERQRFERLLMRFTEVRKPKFPIKVSLVTPAELLPFKVVEVITGKGASVVTDAGDRLVVGDAHQGWKLVSVDSGKVVFTGKQRVEVTL